jgi:hypothetical protein
MASLQVMRGQLSAIQAQLRQPTFLKVWIDDGTEAQKMATQLAKIDEQLELILRDLRSSGHLARLQLDNIRKTPPDRRWSAKQSADQRASDVEDLSASVDSLAAKVKDLLKKNGLITPMEAAKKTIDLIKDLEKHLPHHTKTNTEQPWAYPVLRPVGSDAGSAQLESLVPILTFTYLAIKYLKQKYSSKENQKV